MTMFKRIHTASTLMRAITLLCCVSLGEASAATIQFEQNDEMGCSISVKGVIEKGDAVKLENLLVEQRSRDRANSKSWEILDSPSGRRICFDSPGGNMAEGMAMAEVISGGKSSRGPSGDQLGTAVGRNAKCESACALAFMAGSWGPSEGETVNPNRVMHPTAKLGFHRPNLDVPVGNYSEKEIDAAFSVALDTLKLIINARSAKWLEFPDSLFTSMLSTPHSEMYFIRTVGDAARLSIQVAPAPFFGGTISQAILNFCTSLDGSLLDTDPAVTFLASTENIGLKTSAVGGWTIEGGFREEASSGCTVQISDNQQHPTDQVGYAFIGDYDLDRSGAIWPFQSFSSETPISVLAVAAPISATEFINGARASREVPSFEACFLESTDAQITNVNEYVNVRRQPDFSASVVRQVPLGERVRARRADNITIIGQDRDRQSCISACQAFGADPEDRTARDRAQQCINDNMLWYEITDASRNRGWVSRKFLEEVE